MLFLVLLVCVGMSAYAQIQVSITAPANGATFSAPANIQITATASKPGGSINQVQFFAGTTLIGTAKTAPYSVTWNNVAKGNYSLTAKATDNVGGTATSAAVAITVGTGTGNQPPSVSITSPANGATFAAPANITIQASASDTDGTVSQVQFFAGTTLIATSATAPYSIVWSNVAAGSYALTAKATDNAGATTTSATVNITVSGPNQPPSVNITSPLNGATFTAPANITIQASASDTDGTVSQVQFFAGTTLIGTATTAPYSIVWSNVAAGSYALTAKATDNQGATTTSSAVNITVTTPNTPPSVSITSPISGATFTAPANITVQASASDSDGTVTQVQFFAGTTLIGTATTAPYSIVWSNVAAGSYALTAKATDNAGATTTSAAINITVNVSGNQPPTVSITTPANNSTFAAPANLTVKANATDSDGTIAKVEFFVGGTLIGTDTVAPYSASWSNVSAGTYSLTARATDNLGATTTSSAITVTVTGPGNQPPSVSITSPLNGTSFAAPANITIQASASDPDGTVSRVDFLANNTVIGTATAAPYTFTWTGVATGSYSLTAKATDNAGATGFSTPVNITVGGTGNQLPVVNITSPVNGASFPAGSNISISANASDPDGSVSRVDFFANGSPIGTSTAAPYGITWSNVAAGSYSLTAVATDNLNATGSSPAVAVNVGSSGGPVDFFTPRVDPSNRTGQPAEDLLSGNYNWSLPVVNLSGRAGLNLNLALTYNSLVWVKSGTSITFDADHGFPGPGFRLGFAAVQPRYFDPVVGVNAYLLIMPSGQRIEVRQMGTTNIYESGDSSHIQIVDNGAAGLTVRTPGGTQMTYQFALGEFRCVEVKDRNGNFITVTYNSFGHISTIVDTLGRTISFNYDASVLNNLLSITQIWNGTQHTWAAFTYGTVTLQTNFTGLSLVGVQNGQSITVPVRVSLADGSYFTFDYTSWGQVFRIRNVAADNHELSHIVYDLPLDASVAQVDCPRFAQRRNFAENWNNNAEAISSFSFDPAGLSGGQATTPDGTVYKSFFANSTWQRGLTTQTQVLSSGIARETTNLAYTQDNTSLNYPQNPRVTETNTFDDAGNHKRTSTLYTTFALPSGASCSLPSDTLEYDQDGFSVLRRTHTDYHLESAYLNSRVLGLAGMVSVFDGAGVLASQTAYQYDASVQNQGAPVQHDETNFGSAFVQGRGNLTAIQRFDVTNPAQSLVSTLGYNTVGDVIFTIDPAGHAVNTSYADAFSSGVPPGLTLAYPTAITDPDGFTSTTQYNYDSGAITLTQDPKGAQQIYTYDGVGRISQQTYHDSVNNVDGTYTRYVYPPAMNQLQIFKLLDPGKEQSLTQFMDGAGRVRATMGNFPGSTGGFTSQRFIYDVLGRFTGSSNPTETDATLNPAGDDASTGFVFRSTQLDWAGRPTITTNQDSTTSQVSYTGCGCAGGAIRLITDEVGRRDRRTQDALGRTTKIELLNFDGTVYKTTVNSFNALDLVTSITEQKGPSGAIQTTSMSYDGLGRLISSHRPEQDTGTATHYAYYPDDRLQSETDARGAVKNLGYNGRGSITQVSYIKPNGNPANGLTVTLGYDSAGNRISMTDSLGSVSYTYDTWSRLLDETRTFNDITARSYSLDYTYNLAGQLTSLADPFNGHVFYSYDAAGQLATITGSGRNSVPTYLSSAQYRAFGDPKRIDFGNTATETYRYNVNTQISNFSVFDPAGNKFMGGSVSYFADGHVQNLQDVNRAFDRSFIYDQASRVAEAHSGIGAGLGSQVNGPFDEQFNYDEWDNMFARDETLWGGNVLSTSYFTTYANNRNTAWTYNAEGLPLSTETTQLVYSAANELASSTDASRRVGSRTINLVLDQDYDGDGQIVKQTNNATPTYFIKSSVLEGQTISEVAADGTKSAGFVYSSGGWLVARFVGGTLSWVHINPITHSEGRTQQTGTGTRANELDPLGNDMGVFDPGPVGDDGTAPDLLYPRFGDPTDLSGGCTLDGAPISCSTLSHINPDALALARPTVLGVWSKSLGKFIGLAVYQPWSGTYFSQLADGTRIWGVPGQPVTVRTPPVLLRAPSRNVGTEYVDVTAAPDGLIGIGQQEPMPPRSGPGYKPPPRQPAFEDPEPNTDPHESVGGEGGMFDWLFDTFRLITEGNIAKKTEQLRQRGYIVRKRSGQALLNFNKFKFRPWNKQHGPLPCHPGETCMGGAGQCNAYGCWDRPIPEKFALPDDPDPRYYADPSLYNGRKPALTIDIKNNKLIWNF